MYSNQYNINPKKSEYIYSWYIINDKEDSNAPIIIWLNGGPGASSLEGLFIEKVGPFFLDIETDEFKVNNQSWTRFADLLFVDNPIGVGFSYTEKEYVKSEIEMAEDFMDFLILFYQDHQINEERQLWIAGESYAGKYIPYIAKQIQNYNINHLDNDKINFKINLKGIFMGNGWYSPIDQYKEVPTYAFKHKFIDLKTNISLNMEYNHCNNLILQNELMSAFEYCEPIETNLYKKLGLFGYDTSLKHDIFIKSTAIMSQYLNQPKIKSLLGIYTPGEWTSGDESGPVSDNLEEDVELSILWLIDELITSGIEVTMYNGMRDGTSCNYIANTNVIQKLKAPTAYELNNLQFKSYMHDGIEVGYIKDYKNFTFLLIENSGHFVPLMQPGIISDYIRNKIKYNDSLTKKTIFQ